MIERLISNTAHSAFARSGIYVPPGDGAAEVEVKVILDLAIEVFDGRAVSRVDAADFRISEVMPERGGTLKEVEDYDGLEWEILSRQDDDGIIVTVHMERK